MIVHFRGFPQCSHAVGDRAAVLNFLNGNADARCGVPIVDSMQGVPSVTIRFAHGVAAVLFVLVLHVPALAQQAWNDRVFGGINFGFEGGEASLATGGSTPIYGQSATTSSEVTFGAGPVFDATVGARVRGNIGVSVTYTRQHATADATLSGTVPHPLLFNQARTFTRDLEAFSRTEAAVHISVGYMWPVNDKLDVYVYGGPSSYRLSQDTVGEIRVSEVGAPFTALEVAPVIATSKKSATGYHLGVDGTYRVMDIGGASVGVGGFARYTSATATVSIAGGSVDTTVGGPQAGLGLRIRF